MFFTRPASRKSSARVSKGADATRRRKLFFESLEDRRMLALTLGAWSAVASMPTPRSQAAAAVDSNSHLIYLAGGFNSGGSSLTSFEIYNPVANSWSTGPSLPIPTRGAAAAYASGNIYVFGGFNGGNIGAVQRFNIGSNSWNTFSFPAGSWESASVAANGKIYVFGGEGTDGVTSEFDPATNSTVTKAAMPNGMKQHGAGAIGGFIYVAGGASPVGAQAFVNRYDPVNNSWSTAPADMPSARLQYAGGVLQGNFLAAGGSTSIGNYSSPYFNTFVSYDPATDAWTNQPALPVALRESSGAVDGNSFYVFGGNNGGSESGAVYRISAAVSATGSVGVAIDDSGERLLIFDPATGTQTGLVTIPNSDFHLDTVISPDGKFAYVSSFNSNRIYIVDLTTKALASGTNPLNLPGNIEDLTITPDGKFLLAVDGGNVNPIIVVDTATRATVFTLNEGISHSGVDVTASGDVLVGSLSLGTTRRYTINGAGALTFTGQQIGGGGQNVIAAPNGVTAVQANSSVVTSFFITGMFGASSVTPGGTVQNMVFSPDGTKLYVVHANSVAAYNYNQTTGAIGALLFDVGGYSPPVGWFGVDVFDVTPDGSRLYVSSGNQIVALNALTGANLGNITLGGAQFYGVDIAGTQSNTVVADANGPYTINEGQSLNLDATGSTASASATYEWDVDGDGDFDENITGKTVTVTWAQLQALGIADGPRAGNITVRVTDPGGGGGSVEYVTNGTFESGNTSGWTINTSGSGQWVVNNGGFDPDGPGGSTPPLAGSFDVVSNQNSSSTQFLSQPIVVPSGVTSATLSWLDRIQSYTTFSDPNQEFRVLVLNSSGGLIQQIYSTNPGDPTIQFGPNSRTFNITTLMQSLAGQSIRLSFQVEDQNFFFNVNLDNISLQMATGGGGGGSDTDTTTLTINNVSPTITSFVTPSLVLVGTPINLSAAATDPAGPADPLTFTWTITRPDLSTFTLGGTSPGFVPAQQGSYGVSLAVTDGDGGSATASASINVAGTFVTLSGSDLLIQDNLAGGKNDDLRVSYDPANDWFDIVDPVTLLFVNPIAGTQVDPHHIRVLRSNFSGNILVNTLDGNDSLTVDASVKTTGRPILYDGGNPTVAPGDQLILASAATPVTTTTYNYTNANSGDVSIDGYVVTYTGLEPITSTINAVNVILNYSTTAEILTVISAGAGSTNVSSNVAAETTTFANPTGTLTINAGDTGGDTINFNGLGSGFNAHLTIDGQSGNDVVNLAGAVNLGAGNLNVTAETINSNATVTTSGAAVLNANSGAITDGNGSSVNIVAASLVATATAGISLDTTVANLEASGGSGGVDIEDTDSIIIGGISVPLVGVSATGGNISVVAGGGITVNETVANTGPGNITLTSNSGGGGGGGGQILLIEDQGGFGGASTVLVGAGFNVTVVNNEFANSYANLLNGTFLAGFDFVVYGERGGGGGDVLPPAVAASLEAYIQAGGDLLVTGYDTLGSPSDPNLAGLVRSTTFSDQVSGNPNWTTPNLNHFVLNGPFGDFRNLAFSHIGYDDDVLTPNIGAGAIELARTPGVTSKIIFTDLPGAGGTVGYWNGGLSGNVTNAQPDFSSGGNPQGIFLNWTAGVVGAVASTNDDVTLNANVSASGGNITLNAASDILQNSGSVSTTGSGNVAYHAGTGTTNGVITMADGTSATTGTGLISLDANGNIQVSLLQTGSAAGNAVTVTTTAGAITDADNSNGMDISAVNGGAILSAATGIGGSGSNATIEINVINLDVHNNTSGGIFVTDTAGGLTLSALSGPTSVSGVGGNGLITANSPLTIAASATTSGGMTYTATDSAGPGDNLTINAGVAVTDTTASLTFNAGDDFLLTDTASISAATTVTINIDAGNADAGVGATANIFGALAAPGGAGINGNADNDTFNITGPTVGALDSITAAVTVNGGGGVNNLNLSDANDASGDTATITHTTVEGLGGSPGTDYTYSNIANLDVTAGSGADSLTTNLGTGPAASPTNFNGLVNVNVRGNGGADNMFLHVADSLTNATLDFVRLFGDAGGDNFGGSAAADRIRPVLASGQTQIIINGDAEAKLGPNPLNPGTTGTLTATDRLFLDLTTTDSGATVNPIVIVDTNGGYADAANTQSFLYNGIEDIDLYDNGVLTNTAIGDFFLRATNNPDYILFMSAAQVNPTFRIRIGNQYYPTNGGQYGPYTTGSSKVFVYGQGGNDTISMYNTRLNAAFFGEGGDDILTGGYGDDLLVGGAGNDRINGGTVGGHDTIWGDDFNPATDDPAVASQTSSGGNDQINTFGGNDTIYGQGGNDIINSGAGNDYINGGAGADTIDGQAGNDRIYGGEGNDVISGSDGNDLIAGNDGNDTLNGRTGNDILIGGLGKDILNGHEGGDALVGDESNGSGSKSLAKDDAVDVALTALLLAWGTTPALGSLGGFDSAGADGSEDTLYGGAAADAFFGIALLLDKAPDRVFPGQDLN